MRNKKQIRSNKFSISTSKLTKFRRVCIYARRDADIYRVGGILNEKSEACVGFVA